MPFPREKSIAAVAEPTCGPVTFPRHQKRRLSLDRIPARGRRNTPRNTLVTPSRNIRRPTAAGRSRNSSRPPRKPTFRLSRRSHCRTRWLRALTDTRRRARPSPAHLTFTLTMSRTLPSTLRQTSWVMTSLPPPPAVRWTPRRVRRTPRRTTSRTLPATLRRTSRSTASLPVLATERRMPGGRMSLLVLRTVLRMPGRQGEPTAPSGGAPDAFGRSGLSSPDRDRPGFHGRGEPEGSSNDPSGNDPVRRRRGHAGVRLPCHDPPAGGPGHRAAIPAQRPAAPPSERVEWAPRPTWTTPPAEERISPPGEWHIPSRPAASGGTVTGSTAAAGSARPTAARATAVPATAARAMAPGAVGLWLAPRVEDEDDDGPDTAVGPTIPGDPLTDAGYRRPSRTRLLAAVAAVAILGVTGVTGTLVVMHDHQTVAAIPAATSTAAGAASGSRLARGEWGPPARPRRRPGGVRRCRLTRRPSRPAAPKSPAWPARSAPSATPRMTRARCCPSSPAGPGRCLTPTRTVT